VRLEPGNARTLFSLVKQEGMANVRVVLSGATGPGSPAMVRRVPQGQPRYADGDGGYASQQRSYEDRPVYRSYGWGPPQPQYYERSYRAPPPRYYGPGYLYGD
jgi:hypothetical protein